MSSKGWQSVIQLFIVLGILIAINVISSYWYQYFDLTEEKKYTLTEATENLIDDVDEPIFVKILLDGNLPSGFKRLRNSTRELLNQFNGINGNVSYEFDDPNEGSVQEINFRREELYKDKIVPTKVDYFEGDEFVQKFIYPYALVYRGERFIKVNLLESLLPGMSEDESINNSISLLEYKMTNAIQRILRDERKNIVFTGANGELTARQTAKLRTLLREQYNTATINLDSVVRIPPEVDLMMVIKPQSAFDNKDLFKIDQYIMNGGKVIWLIDPLRVDVNKINGALSTENKFYIPDAYPLGLNDLFFKYGARINQNMVLDLECSAIPQVTGMQGDQVQTSLFKYFYHPIVSSLSDHPIVKNIDRINMFFPASIDTIQTRTPLKKTVLLQSSPYSRFQMVPARLNFEILKYDPDVSKFNKGRQNLALLNEGIFESFFKNRVTQESLTGLKSIGVDFRTESVPTKQLFVADGDFVRSTINPTTNEISPLGLNEWERKVYYGNEDFILNAVEYMMDENGVLASRSKEVKMRLLDVKKLSEEKSFWQFLNIILPLLILLIGGFLFFAYRRRKYTRS